MTKEIPMDLCLLLFRWLQPTLLSVCFSQTVSIMWYRAWLGDADWSCQSCVWNHKQHSCIVAVLCSSRILMWKSSDHLGFDAKMLYLFHCISLYKRNQNNCRTCSTCTGVLLWAPQSLLSSLFPFSITSLTISLVRAALRFFALSACYMVKNVCCLRCLNDNRPKQDYPRLFIRRKVFLMNYALCADYSDRRDNSFPGITLLKHTLSGEPWHESKSPLSVCCSVPESISVGIPQENI